MEKRIISKYNLQDMYQLSKSCNSTLYVDNEDLIKYLNDPVFDDSWELREKKLEILENVVEAEFVLPKYLVYLDNSISSNLRGYGMNYLKSYNTLESVLNNYNYSYKDKLDICKKICDTFVSLEKYKIAYWDIHSDNILINGKDIKVCDMDAATSKSIDGEYLYRVDLADSYRHLTSMVLSILYDIDQFDLIKILQRKGSRKFVKESKMFSRVANPEGYIFYPDKYLDNFTEDYIKETKKLLLR